MNDNTSFVDFYNKHNISPVSQNISNLEEHFQRRNSLLAGLGIPSAFINGSSVLEFGAGSGHNSTYIASLSPDKYHLVDGSNVGIRETERILSEYKINDLEIIQSLFLDYSSNSLFDLVWAEGCIPHQANSICILKHLSQYTKKSGIFVITTINGISHLSETIRRLVSHMHINSIEAIDAKVKAVRPLHEKHLQYLKGMSRPVDDWILDVIIQPLHKSKLFSIPDAIDVLQNEYDIYGTSPRFITDWRWYKDIIGTDRGFNKTALDSYYQNNLNLIDYRFTFPAHASEYGINLERLCNNSWSIMSSIQNGDTTQWDGFINLLNDISSVVKIKSPETSRAITEASFWLQNGAPLNQKLKYFPRWWGRGQQYASFIRK